MSIRRGIAAIFAALGVGAGSAMAQEQQAPDLPDLNTPENILYLDTEDGRITIQTRPDKAPKTVARIKELARRGFYDGLIFHRVIEGFMAQGGDPAGDGSGGSGQTLEAEFNDLPHMRGTLSMARLANDENSADSQFFICFNRWAQGDGEYTVWGRVIDGMDVVEQINRGEPPFNPTRIVRVRVAADATG